jgi:L-fuconolactonase
MSLEVVGHYRYPSPDGVWLERHAEQILEPERGIIDAHHHLWEEPGNRYLADEFGADLASGHRIEATVFVQAHFGYRRSGPEEMKPVGETEAVVAMVESAPPARRAGSIAAGIVGFADLTLGSRVEAVLEAHLAAGRGRFKGVRHSVARDSNFPDGIVLRPAPAGLLADRRYRAGLEVLARHGMSYDAMLYHQQIPELTAVAKKHPDLRIVLDHLGCMIGVGPYKGRERETFAKWRGDLADLASCPNVSIKLGGLGMVICGATWHQYASPPTSAKLAQQWRPQIETCIELFGAARCMFESNFPVDKGMFSYAVVWNSFKRLASGASNHEKDFLFRETANEFYRLGL